MGQRRDRVGRGREKHSRSSVTTVVDRFCSRGCTEQRALEQSCSHKTSEKPRLCCWKATGTCPRCEVLLGEGGGEHHLLLRAGPAGSTLGLPHGPSREE